MNHPPQPAARSDARGFTLVELLVVVGILAVLLSLLLPALGGARRAARGVACLSNVRQLNVAFLMYLQESQGVAMPYSEVAGLYWHQLIAPYLGDSQYTTQSDSPQLGSMAVMLCPEAATLPNGEDAANGGGIWGSATTAWHWGDGGTGSYGLNLWFLPEDPYYRGSNNPPGYMTADRYYQNLVSASPPSEVPTIADCAWVGSWPDSNDLVPTDLQNGYQPHATGYFMGRFCIARHDKAVNIAFADGSCRRIPLAELWQLSWHNNWSPRTVSVP